jgi:hypothetical protein
MIATVEKCIEGVTMRLAPFLLKQFLIDCMEAQDKGMEFYYYWLLLLISLAAWKELEDVQFLDMRGKSCLAAKYQNLCYMTHKG